MFFQAEDFNYCSTVIRRLIELNHQPSWQVSSQLGRCDKFRDLKFRRECLWFVVNVGPDDLLQETIKYINVLDTEILDFDLQDWVDLNQSSFECEEFADAISSVNKILILLMINKNEIPTDHLNFVLQFSAKR